MFAFGGLAAPFDTNEHKPTYRAHDRSGVRSPLQDTPPSVMHDELANTLSLVGPAGRNCGAPVQQHQLMQLLRILHSCRSPPPPPERYSHHCGSHQLASCERRKRGRSEPHQHAVQHKRRGGSTYRTQCTRSSNSSQNPRQLAAVEQATQSGV